jgi:hypothetical protein
MQGQSNPAQILQTGMPFWASKTLLSAVELGLFTELARGAQSLESIKARPASQHVHWSRSRRYRHRESARERN